jgi:hypothetical protein
LIDETQSFGGVAWVTVGREIENYLPVQAIQSQFAAAKTSLAPFEDIADYIERVKPGASKRFERKKVLFAESILPALTRESMVEHLDLEKRMAEIVWKIKTWNGLA